MLPRRFRLHQRKDFQTLHRVKPYYRSKDFLIKIRDNNLNHPRFGIIVGTRVSKKAVDRNRIKRKLRACARIFIESTEGRDVLIIVHKDIQKIQFVALESILQKIFGATMLSKRIAS
ncbi:MAG: ribonuclease P protein component [Candidatus Kerfeldbacteria bacterium RIFCSPHIGHO2_02_FULL_42_14]|uniref:Ribonuclease P protein component n=1 Tax=Candidatus Kerfeldbacteria bacterium RIFCSPHIGHO2_02_FULL_42_14 TaxID=1798540 RepID=A0A1G2API9_9BACT|nr:MAG: ribonuclease P protein component [Candidatus Kerfeldbacteria bacterium RIFCSPHIGHO2_02_FULL_42_14]OGY80936.1 MAG: ribonuclease P protein component [Candidatus Kerfeldbacteria bacterium RIFCSPHIGHO2_12_FULL_42_13]OGY84170.1 MAG: ribonuclease P protein component [Candidatus Kerfeldbacteria bacterium RIFCSPLOWO2_02_FULL_42_19]OGY87301.1 MAG: ribonuclease P protein component [Candidatus Kerfeldbacteria bacterium RIFCSPLOWO2_12_FULL_43_9]